MTPSDGCASDVHAEGPRGTGPPGEVETPHSGRRRRPGLRRQTRLPDQQHRLYCHVVDPFRGDGGGRGAGGGWGPFILRGLRVGDGVRGQASHGAIIGKTGNSRSVRQGYVCFQLHSRCVFFVSFRAIFALCLCVVVVLWRAKTYMPILFPAGIYNRIGDLEPTLPAG